MRHRFRVGDKVKRTGDDYIDVTKGHVYVVREYYPKGGNDSLIIEGSSIKYDASKFILVQRNWIANDIDWLDAVQRNFRE